MERKHISEEEAARMMQRQQQQQEQQEAQSEQIDSMLRAFCSAEGRERLKRIEQVKPERAQQVSMMIIQSVRSGKMQPPVGDDMVRQLLAGASEDGGAKTTNITFARKRMDDDW